MACGAVAHRIPFSSGAPKQLGIAIEAALVLRLFRFDLKRMGFGEGIVAKERQRLPGCHFVLLF